MGGLEEYARRGPVQGPRRLSYAGNWGREKTEQDREKKEKDREGSRKAKDQGRKKKSEP